MRKAVTDPDPLGDGFFVVGIAVRLLTAIASCIDHRMPHRSRNPFRYQAPSLRVASRAPLTSALTDWEDHRFRPLIWTLCCENRSRHRSLNSGGGFLLSP